MPEVPLQQGIAQIITQLARPIATAVESMPQMSPRYVGGSITGNETLALAVGGAGTVRIHISGAWTGQLLFEATLNEETWFETRVLPIPLPTIPPPTINPFLTSTSINGLFVAAAGGLFSLRVRGAGVSGVATLSMLGTAPVLLVGTVPLTPMQIIGWDTVTTLLSNIYAVLQEIRDNQPGPPG